MTILNFNNNLPAEESNFIPYIYTLNSESGHNSCHSQKEYTTEFYVL
jgi:hypothetical protein